MGLGFSNPNICPNLPTDVIGKQSKECTTKEHLTCDYYIRDAKKCGGEYRDASPKVEYTEDECFVATACHGKDDKVTQLLRNWRDQMRRQGNEKAVSFIDFYYEGFGYNTAKILRKLPLLKKPARWAIKLFMKVMKIK